jgi:hypothetical protein
MEYEQRPIVGFPGYFADSDGLIWTVKRKGGNDRSPGQLARPRLLKTHLDRRGYLSVSLQNGRSVTRKPVHFFVLLAFSGEPGPGEEACHYPDPTKTNNAPSNLRWASHAENMSDKHRDRPIGNKPCSRCGVTYPPERFYSDKRARDGKTSDCKKCHTIVAMGSRDQDKRRASNREFMRRSREKERATP